MEKVEDAFGQFLLDTLESGDRTAELIEREDNFIDHGSNNGLYFFDHEEWEPIEQQAIESAQGNILDIGCGAGRHLLYLQEKGLEATAIDSSPGAVEVCRLRGVKNALVSDVWIFRPMPIATDLQEIIDQAKSKEKYD